MILGPWRGRVPLWRAFWLGVVPSGFCLYLVAVSLPRRVPDWVWPVLAALFLLWLAWSIVSLWRCARNSRGWVRYPAQVAIVLAVIWAIGFLSLPRNDYTTRAKVQEGVNLSSPARTALGIACSERALVPGIGHAELGLGAPAEFTGTYTRSVEAFVDAPDTGRVVIVLKAIGGDVEDGQTLVYHGTCGSGGMTWTVSGTVDARYRPKI